MHPAYSVILFTTASGAGYGLLIWMAVAAVFELLPAGLTFRIAGLGLALTLVVVGLLSSTAHLGRPERAWRAFSQWTTSWLSREGVAAVFTFAPVGVFALTLVFAPEQRVAVVVSAVASVLGALATLYCTGMIYASLRTVPAWNQSIVAPGYIVLGMATGGVLYVLLMAMFPGSPGVVGWLTIAALAAAAILKWSYWSRLQLMPRRWTAEDATGLGGFGKVRQLDPPHTQANFVMREMGYKVARKHVAKLRTVALVTLSVLPIIFLLLIMLMGGVLAPVWAALATASAGLGVLIERWLFFAEAEHIVTVYYGAEAV